MQTKLERYKKVTALAGLGIWERNLVSGEVYWNMVVRGIYGVNADANPGLEESLAFYDEPERLRAMLDYAAEGGGSQSADLRLTAKDGKRKWVRIRVRADKHTDGRKVIYGTLEDITEQVGLFQQVSQQERQFHQAFEFAPIGMALVSLKGEWIRVNPTLIQMLGYSSEEFLARTFQQLTYPDDLQSDLKQMQQLINGETGSYQMDKRYLHKDGSLIWASLHVSLVRDQAGCPLYFVSQLKDISERKRMEYERLKTMELISRQNSRLLNFAHIVSHNLRTHAGNIQLIIQMLATETDPAEKEQLTGLLAINAANLQDTLAHLNEVVDVQASGTRIIKKLHLLTEVNKISAVLALSLKKAGGTLLIAIPKSMHLSYDQAYLDSILLNLLTNAIKYRDQQRPLCIEIKAWANKDKIKLTVRDNGRGIDIDRNGEKLFGMYSTFHGNDDARGIGLFLVKSQVEVMGGSIAASSKPGKGTTFTLCL
ncbi:MAG: PAS domain S-box protein [Bacteroidota bacterium]|nr:PAS domain S-box protein [Bacteroidota bacterium]